MDLTNNLKENNVNLLIPFEHGGNLEQEAKAIGCNPKQLLDASASIVPFPPPKELLDCITQTLHSSTLRNYPDRNHSSLKESIATWHQIDSNMVLPGNGAAELITWSARDAAMIGSNSLLAPCFLDYERALRCWGAEIIYTPMKLEWSSKQPQAFPLKSNAKVIWITNPHNPTGQLWDHNSLIPLLERHSLIICDEAFLPLVPNGEKHSLIPFTQQYKNLIVIRSLTKLFGIAGLRLGYAISSSNRLQQWQSWRDPWPMNSLAISAGIMLMRNKELTSKWMKKIHKWVKKEGQWLHSNLNNLDGIVSHPSSTNFHLIQGTKSLLDLRTKLLKQKRVILRDCRSFHNLNSHWLRISLQKRSNNKKILRSIIEVLKEHD